MNQVAVVIGGGQTLGAFRCRGLATEGYRVAVVDIQSDKAANGQGFTEGMYTGALRNMAEMNEAYGCVRRGIYQKRVRTAEESSEDILSNRVLEILSNTKAQLTNCNISVFDIPRMSERDKKVVEQIGKIAEDIDRLIKRLN